MKKEGLNPSTSITQIPGPLVKASSNQTVATVVNDGSLTKNQKKRYVKLEKVIYKGKKTFMEVAGALVEIRDERLYRLEYKTFEEYCAKKWDIQPRHAYRLIDASEVVNNLKSVQLDTNEVLAIPDSESTARPYTKLPPEKQVEASKLAAKKSPKPTAKQVAEAVDEVSGKPISKQPNL
jgi:hypothetical protein